MISNNKIQRAIASFELQLNNTQVSVSAIRYKNHSKLYCLNLSKLMIKDIYMLRGEQPYFHEHHQLVVTNSLQNSTSQKFKSVSKNFGNNLIAASNFKLQKIKEIYSKDDNSDIASNQNKSQRVPQQKDQFLTSESGTVLKIQGSPIKQQSPPKLRFRDKIEQNNRKINFKTITKFIKKQQAKNHSCHETQSVEKQVLLKKQIKNLQNKKQTVSKTSTTNSKKLLLPQIKQNPEKDRRNNTYSLNQKSNIPLFCRDQVNIKNIKSQSYALVQYPSGQLLLTNKSVNQYEIASLTKIMTFYTVRKIASKFKVLIQQQQVQINDHATEMSGTSAQIKVGEIYSVEQLLYGLMLPSGNDAATALAEWGGNYILRNSHENKTQNYINSVNEEKHSLRDRIKAFINQMNVNAKQCGLKSTRYANQHGLSHHQAKSTAVDTARLCFLCMDDELFRKVVSTQIYKCFPLQINKAKGKRQVVWKNTNKLLRREGFIGIKTGITVTAGPCLASAYKFRDKVYICVILRASKISRRFKQTRKIIAGCLQKLYKDTLSAEQQHKLQKLKKNNKQLDSDYSEDEDQFNYQSKATAQFKKRDYIINYEM